ncbi:ring-cleaving dioxygenase [Dictyobacter arantiisoli]|uniref:Glyoxalase n=1 Tax=Dictyobacter arantiisoli TaxID=2014874 RepID=A0A5A5TH42_9CHLR|nr:ring-cleaving dioxygenase [Dictyobacter arantiisoli]GCF10632.1 glyoxalase [Dictyobacter arantiisoli]
MQLTGLHHISAITGNASLNVAFYTQVLGLHLVKKTVNQDDVAAYHLYYGDDIGHAGTALTFFDWAQAGPNRPGVGTISAIMLGVTGRSALEWWVTRLDSFQVQHEGIKVRGKNESAYLAFTDPEGQHVELVDDLGKLGGQPWKGSPVPAEMRVRGLYGVRILVRDVALTERLLTGTMGFRRADTIISEQQSTIAVFEVGAGGPGTEVHVDIRPDLNFGSPAIGGVHHVSFRTPDEKEHAQWREKLARVVRGVTPIIERFYFKAIYFREPNGVLFEISTDGPGFGGDEDIEHLGELLALPPFLEPHRAEIEAGLKPIRPVHFDAKN